ncbi:MAG: glycosyltransferase family 1 protein [Promethearchaeota archaeon]|nr:MAG: glycosyltransferase family 1 protein [Candidatus Lokiarchaeota archaeon]
MNIVRLTTRIFPDKAGPAVYAFFLSKSVSDKHFHMFNITCRPRGVFEKIKIINPFFKIYYLPIKATRWDANLIEHLIFLLKFGIYSFKKILKIHRKYRIDLIHCDNPAVTGLIASVFNRLFKIPFIYTHHGLDSHFKVNYLIELRLIHKFSSFNIVVSRSMIRFFKKNKVDVEKIVWIPVGIDFGKFYHVNTMEEKLAIMKQLNINKLVDVDDFIILYVGYMDLKQKVLGMIDFLNAFNKFLKNRKEKEQEKLKLIYLGDGKYKDLLEKEVENLNLRNNVYLLGITSEIEKFYAISDIGALTSYIEGFPIAILEAIASNLACICTDVGEVKEMVDEESIISCGNREEIAKKLNLFFENKERCKMISQKSLQKIRKFDWVHVANKIKNLYRKTINKQLQKDK